MYTLKKMSVISGKFNIMNPCKNKVLITAFTQVTNSNLLLYKRQSDPYFIFLKAILGKKKKWGFDIWVMIIHLGSRMVFWHFSSRSHSLLGREGYSYSSLCITIIMEKYAYDSIPENFFLHDPSSQRSLLSLVHDKPGWALPFHFHSHSCWQCFKVHILGHQLVGDRAYVIPES